MKNSRKLFVDVVIAGFLAGLCSQIHTGFAIAFMVVALLLLVGTMVEYLDGN